MEKKRTRCWLHVPGLPILGSDWWPPVSPLSFWQATSDSAFNKAYESRIFHKDEPLPNYSGKSRLTVIPY